MVKNTWSYRDPALIPSTYITVYKSIDPVSGSPLLSFDIHMSQSCLQCTYKHVGKTVIHIKKNIVSCNYFYKKREKKMLAR